MRPNYDPPPLEPAAIFGHNDYFSIPTQIVNEMPLYSMIAGVALVILGLVGYSLSDAENPGTALIPAGWGIVLLICGAFGYLSPGARKHAMHAVALLALLGVLLPGVRLAMVLADDKPDSTLGVASLALMAVINAILLVLCVRSFREARRNRAS